MSHTLDCYTFTSKRAHLPGNAVVAKLSTQTHIESDLPIVIVTEPQHALRFMRVGDELLKCTATFPISLIAVQDRDYVPPLPSIMGTRGKGGRGLCEELQSSSESFELVTKGVILHERLSIEDYIHTPEFCDWLIRNVVKNADFIRICFANFSEPERRAFISRFPIEFIKPYVNRFNGEELHYFWTKHEDVAETLIKGGDVALPEDAPVSFKCTFARLHPDNFIEHDDKDVRLAANIALVHREPLAYLYDPVSALRLAAYLKAVEIHGEAWVAARFDFSKEIDPHNRRHMLNKYSCQHFINDPNKAMRIRARTLRGNLFDQLWLKFNKE